MGSAGQRESIRSAGSFGVRRFHLVLSNSSLREILRLRMILEQFSMLRNSIAQIEVPFNGMIQLLPSRTYLCLKPQAGVCGQGLWGIVSWSITSLLRMRGYFPTGAFQDWNVNTRCHGTIKFFPALRVTCTKPQLGFGGCDAHWFVIEDHHICMCVLVSSSSTLENDGAVYHGRIWILPSFRLFMSMMMQLGFVEASRVAW